MLIISPSVADSFTIAIPNLKTERRRRIGHTWCRVQDGARCWPPASGLVRIVGRVGRPEMGGGGGARCRARMVTSVVLSKGPFRGAELRESMPMNNPQFKSLLKDRTDWTVIEGGGGDLFSRAHAGAGDLEQPAEPGSRQIRPKLVKFFQRHFQHTLPETRGPAWQKRSCGCWAGTRTDPSRATRFSAKQLRSVKSAQGGTFHKEHFLNPDACRQAIRTKPCCHVRARNDGPRRAITPPLTPPPPGDGPV